MRETDERGYNWKKKQARLRIERNNLKEEAIKAAREWIIPVPHCEENSYDKFTNKETALTRAIVALEEHIKKHGEYI